MEKEVLVSALRDLTETTETLLSGAKDAVQESVEQFVDKKITKLFGLASAYRKLFERLDVQTKEELERKLQQSFKHVDVQEAYDDWQDAETRWDSLLKDVDGHLQRSGPQAISQGQVMPLDHPLVDARTGKPTCLKDLLAPPVIPVGLTSAPSPSSSSSPEPESKSGLLRETTSLVLILLRHFA